MLKLIRIQQKIPSSIYVKPRYQDQHMYMLVMTKNTKVNSVPIHVSITTETQIRH